MFHITLEEGHSLLTMLAVAAAAVVLAGVFYRRIFAQVMPARWRLLLALRTAAILLIVFLLFRSVLSLEPEELQRRAVILALDASSSMSTADDATGTTRFERARTRVLDWSSRLKKDFDLHVLEFSEQATPLDRPGDLARLKPTGEATSLSRALVAVARVVPRRDVEAVVLFSDGIHNAAGDPVAAVRKLGVVVHAIGVGNSLRNSPSYRDARVADLECPEQLPVNNRARITAHVGQAGLGGQVVKAILEEDGKPLDQAEMVLRDGDVPRQVAFQFVPTVKGRHTYTVRIPPVPEEKIAQNKHRSALVQVVDSKIRVLHLEGTLRAEYGAIAQRFLDNAYYEPDSAITILAAVRDKEGEGTEQAEVLAQVKTPQGTTGTVILAPVAGSAGSYQGSFEPKRPGTYQSMVETRLGETVLKAEQTTAEVGRPSLEFDRLDLDDALLSRIAEATGGRYFHISTADQLIGELDRKEKRRHVSLEQPLYFPRLFWVVFVGVLTTEWALRRRFQLR